MPHMLSRHKGATRRSAHRGAAVVLHELNTRCRQCVEVRGSNFLLTITSDITDPHIIGQDKYNVRLLLFGEHSMQVYYTQRDYDVF